MEYLGLLLLLEALAGEVLRRRGGVKPSGRKTIFGAIDRVCYFQGRPRHLNRQPILQGDAAIYATASNVGLFIPPSARKTVIGTRGATLQIIGI